MQAAVVSMGFDAYPYCGDGVDFLVEYRPVVGPIQILFDQAFDPDPDHRVDSFRKRVEANLNISAGDVLEFLLFPRGNDGCDGFGVLDIEVWPAGGLGEY